MNYSKIKKIDEESLQKLKEGSGPSDKCLCALLSPPEDGKGLRASIKKAFASLGQLKKGKKVGGQNSVVIPLSSLSKGGGKFRTMKEKVKRKSSCGKCACDNENIVLKHSYANIRITSPDVSSICPCPTDCMPGKENFKNNIKVTIEHMRILDIDSTDSKFSFEEMKPLDLNVEETSENILDDAQCNSREFIEPTKSQTSLETV